MAATVAGTRLTEAHRVSQLAIRSAFLRQLLRLWPLLRLDELDESAVGWIDATTDLVIAHRAASAARALSYYEAFRRAETGLTLPERDLYQNLGLGRSAAIRVSLLVTGPIGIKSRLAKGVAPRVASMKALTDVAGAASRHVLDGGRQMIRNSVQKDQVAQGWARVTDGDPCAFCAMLASRGAEFKYSSAESAKFATEKAKKRPAGEKYHDHCGCEVEPVYDKDTPLPGRSDEFAKLWADTTGDVTGKAKFKAFREAYEAQRGNGAG